MLCNPFAKRIFAICLIASASGFLAGCEESGLSPLTRSFAPVPPQTLAAMEAIGSSKNAPVLIRTYKKEAELEIWKMKADGRYAYLKSFPMCRWSGQLGPKVREGDRQVPEGFYSITPARMNPNSAYYLSFDVGYPNAYDRAMGHTGGSIMVHGVCSSAGCFSMTDAQIAEIYGIAREAFASGQRAIQMQSYPFHMTAENFAKYRRDPNIGFWNQLKEGSDNFEVTKQDVETKGELPETQSAQAKLAYLPYRNVLEAIAEKFHSDLDYLKELNPGVGEDLQAGAKLSVPNVLPFEVTALKTPRSDGPDSSASGAGISVHVNTAESMLTVLDGERIRAAFPITSGSQHTASPIGNWIVKGIAKLPEFRWDEKMLEEGERSSNFVMLPPGPNNPVGVIWIALNKKGIGIHGTDEPDTIGRSASHGCIRLANWDVARLAEMVKAGVPVAID